MGKLAGKVAIVSGGGRGIGRAIAEAYLKDSRSRPSRSSGLWPGLLQSSTFRYGGFGRKRLDFPRASTSVTLRYL